MEDHLARWADANSVPGAAVAVVEGGEVTTYVHGVDGDGDPVEGRTPFLLGSVAKTMTSTVVLGLAQDGHLGLDDPVSEHLPWLDAPEVTVRQLLTHTAGYRLADGLAVSERQASGPDALREATADLEHTGTVGQYEYTSAGYLVLGAVVEAVTGQPYGTVLDRRVLQPLGMTATSTRGDDLPPGHRLWWGVPRPYEVDLDESGAAYATVVSTVEDVATYARAALAGDLLPDEVSEEAWRPQVSTGEDRGYGFGWSIDTSEEETVVHHTGATPGHFAHLLLVPSQDRAVIVLANAYAEARAPSLAQAARAIDSVTRGDEASLASGDPLLGALPWLVLTPGVLGVAATSLVRRGSPTRRLRVSSFLAGGSAMALVALPWAVGHDPRFFWNWMPDVAVGLVLSVVSLAALALRWAALAARGGSGMPSLRRAERHLRG